MNGTDGNEEKQDLQGLNHDLNPGFNDLSPEVQKLLNCGIIAVDKPQGPSSHQVTAWVKEIFGDSVTKIGHGGTLDPMVSGVLIIMLGRAVRLAPVILKHRKEYIAVLRLHADVSPDAVKKVAEEMTGRVYQRPPRRSAVRRQLRIRTIHEIEVLDCADRLVLLRIDCEAGTYIRSLCTHIALALGVGGQMEELRRTKSGAVTDADVHTLQDIKDAFVFARNGNSEPLLSMLLPAERLTGQIPTVKIRDTAVEALCCGASLAGTGVISRENYKRDALVAVMTEKDELVCIGRAIKSSEEYKPGDTGIVLNLEAVIMERGNYEKGWTKKEYSGPKVIKPNFKRDEQKKGKFNKSRNDADGGRGYRERNRDNERGYDIRGFDDRDYDDRVYDRRKSGKHGFNGRDYDDGYDGRGYGRHDSGKKRRFDDDEEFGGRKNERNRNRDRDGYRDNRDGRSRDSGRDRHEGRGRNDYNSEFSGLKDRRSGRPQYDRRDRGSSDDEVPSGRVLSKAAAYKPRKAYETGNKSYASELLDRQYKREIIRGTTAEGIDASEYSLSEDFVSNKNRRESGDYGHSGHGGHSGHSANSGQKRRSSQDRGYDGGRREKGEKGGFRRDNSRDSEPWFSNPNTPRVNNRNGYKLRKSGKNRTRRE
ncbi:MAG: RNA-guided pseudouridylation complex pseudouridine synthase subunit Cbf5 [Methanomicrobium sp.]|nr:RNA-guided pseudouridylation complex pseudouridine synthase subunit Cbf5 [Methanomicrobium sp.]